MIKYGKKSLISLCLIFTVLICTVLSTIQHHDRINYAAAVQFDLIRSATRFVKTYLLYPYISCFTGIKEIPAGLEKSAAPVAAPAKKRGGGLFRNIYMLLGAILVTNRTEFLLFLICLLTVRGFMRNRGIIKRAREDIPIYSFYIDWILRFMSPLEKFLRSLVNDYDIAHEGYIVGEGNRILAGAVKMRFFFVIDGGIMPRINIEKYIKRR